MEKTFIVDNIVKMLLKPIDLETFRTIYIKAPQKKLASIPKKISVRLKNKLINDLLEEKNISYTLTQIKNGRLDKFYHFKDQDMNDYKLTKFKELITKHDPTAAYVLLGLIKLNDIKSIEYFFKNEITIFKELESNWDKISWNFNVSTRIPTLENKKVEIDGKLSIENRKLEKELVKAKKANTKLKDKLNLLNKDKGKSEDALRKEFKQKIKKIKKEHANILSAERKNFEKEKQKFIDEKKRLLKMDSNDCAKLTQKLQLKSNELSKAQRILSLVKRNTPHTLTLVTLNTTKGLQTNGYIYMGAPNSVNEMVEWIDILVPKECILVQELISKAFWLELLHELENRNIKIEIKFKSKYELIEK